MKLRLVRTLPAYVPRPVFTREDYNLDAVLSVAFVPGSNDVVGFGRFGIQRFALDATRRWQIAASGRWPSTLAISPDGTRLLTIADDEDLVERDLGSGDELRRAQGVWSTRALAFSADGRDLVWGGSAVRGNAGGFSVAVVELLDTTTFEVRWRWTGEDWRSVSGAAFTPGGLVVAQGTRRSALRLDLTTGAVLKTLRPYADELLGSRDGRTVVFRGDHELRVHRDGRLAGKVAVEHRQCAIAPSGRFTAISASNLTVSIVDLAAPRITSTITFDDADLDRVTSLACTDDGLVAVGCVGGWIHIAQTV
jgi:WD40 repeat protein